MTVLEREAPPTLDPAARLVSALARIQGVASDMTAEVGHNRPISTRDQLRLAAASDDVMAAVEAYQPTVLAAVAALSRLGLAEQGVPHQQAFPPCGVSLRTELVTADELILGDRAVPVERMVVGPAKDAFAHFHRIDGTSAPHGGQVVLGWGSEDRVVAVDWPFARVSTGRVVTETEDGPEAHYEWETGR